jgi:hypothetical protein
MTSDHLDLASALKERGAGGGGGWRGGNEGKCTEKDKVTILSSIETD